ncbi:MAG TPA: ABC transporter permease [Gemmatimonadaceae bacterium]|nr:ABC transporter permease [Gemmatimonadaceae bacterium]
MTDAPRWRRYLRFWGPDPAADVDDELRFHVDMLVQELIAAGVPAAAARAEAERRFGAVPPVREACLTIDQRRARRGARMDSMHALVQDIRYALRTIRKSPGFSLVVIITLALGIGATTAMFSVVDRVLLRSLPYRAPEQLVALAESGSDFEHSYPDYLDWKERSQGLFSNVVAWQSTNVGISGGGEPEILWGDRVSASAAKMLGVTPLLGRAFRPEEELVTSERVVMISERLWQRRFGGDPHVIGRTLTISGYPFTIVGVLPPTERVRLPTDLAYDRQPDFWMPLRLTAESAPRSLHFLGMMARVEPGITPAQMRDRMRAISAALAHDGVDTVTMDAYPLSTRVAGDTGRPLAILLGAVGMLLLIACANVANLLLARAAVRERELGIRVALGAGRARIFGQLLAESVVRALLGGAAGVALAYASIWAAHRWLDVTLPRFTEVRIDARILGFAVALSVVAGILFGIAPALRAMHAQPGDALREGGRGLHGSVHKDRVRRALIVAEVSLSFVLLVGAGLLIRTLDQLLAVDRGFEPAHVLTAQIGLSGNRYPDSTAIRGFYQRFLTDVRSIPDVKNAALTSELPGPGTNGGIKIEGQTFPPHQLPMVQKRIVSNGYFETMKARLVAGRFFAPSDAPGAPPVVIVNQPFVERWFHGRDPIGHRVDFSWDTHGLQTIVGVVGDMHETTPDGPPAPAMYIPAAQHPVPWLALVVRSRSDQASLVTTIRARLKAIDPELPLSNVQTLSDVVGASVSGQRLSASILAAFALLALMLAAVGLYGVISYSVAQRTQELGIRAALGAGRSDLVRLVMRQGAGLVLAGLVVGVGAALATGRLLASQLFGVGPSDPVTFAVVALLLAGVACLATVVPALRATRVDPAVTLRAE